MLTVYAFGLANVSAALLVGGPLNVLALWAIRGHTPAELRPFARLLSQTAIVDLIVLTLSFTMLPVGCYWCSKCVIGIIIKEYVLH
jgi:uncharacterized membrane protein